MKNIKVMVRKVGPEKEALCLFYRDQTNMSIRQIAQSAVYQSQQFSGFAQKRKEKNGRTLV